MKEIHLLILYKALKIQHLIINIKTRLTKKLLNAKLCARKTSIFGELWTTAPGSLFYLHEKTARRLLIIYANAFL
jgi:hypothetical protein